MQLASLKLDVIAECILSGNKFRRARRNFQQPASSHPKFGLLVQNALFK